ncbi:tetratricopeptide repeat protein [Streptomyces sp. NPDC044571]|uniref:tetratricopeptide repeat protein n=1 Tax=Streptomyces sp. NPDC044571 TaxID=3155371 RepID=UPI0034092EF5
MAVRGPSRQELIRRRRSSGFIGRQGQVTAFRDVLRQPPEEAAQFFFHIRGPAGVGKSTLVRQLDTTAREGGAITACVDESVADVIETMEVISAQFAQQGAALKNFDKLLSTYRQRRHEADAGVVSAVAGADAAAGGGPSPSPSSVIASQLGLVGLGMIPGVGAFTGAVDPNQLAAGADRVKALLSTRLRSHGDVELVLSPVDALAPVFLEELGEVARRHPWVALFFDTYERTGPMLDTWLRDVLVSDRHGELPANVLVTLAGQAPLAARCWEDWRDLVTDWPLEVFTDSEARQLLTGKGVTDERVVEMILHLSGRLPVLVSTLAEAQPGTVEEIGDPSGTAVERFLKWETDPARRAAALACAFPQELDEDVYRAAVEEEAAELFGWLRSMPFVTDRSGHCRYHEVVRSTMLRLQRRQSPARWEQLHTRLADTFGQRRARLEEAATPADGWWSDESWRGHRLQETYHRLCAAPRGAVPAALRELLDAYDHDVTTLRRWVQVVVRAGRDTESGDLTGWGERLQTALARPDPGTATLTLLLTRAGLAPDGRCLALTLRARDHRNAGRYPQALTDYAQALALDPQAARIHFGLGRTHELMERYEEAIADYSRALELKPGDFPTLANRGVAYRFAERFEEALADLDRAVELDPTVHWVITIRGIVHQLTGRHEEATADFTRAMETGDGSAWACVNRGNTHTLGGRYEQALADFDRAIELAPDYDLAFTSRGLVHRYLGRYEEALADLRRALELRPDSAWALACKGDIHRSMQRYDEALADFDRAIEREPDSSWALTGRGETFRLMARHEEALADFDRVVERAPDYHWALHLRASLLEKLGRFEGALADFARLGELRPDDHWAATKRGDVHRLLGRYEEALADYGVAAALRPAGASALTARGLTYRLLGRYDEALVDLTRATELEPGFAWTHYEKAVVLHALRHPDRDGELARTVEILAPGDAGDRSASDAGNLLLAHCLWPRWEQAEQNLAEFLGCNPPPGQMRELLAALRSLALVVPSAQPRLEPLCRTVEDRIAEPS